MEKTSFMDLLTSYSPAPSSKRRSTSILDAACREFETDTFIFNGDRDEDFRALITFLRRSDPHRALSIAATLTEAAFSLDKPRLASSLLLSVANLNPWRGHRPTEIGDGLIRCADSLGRTETSLRDIVRLLVIYSQLCENHDIHLALDSLVDGHYMQSLDRLANGLDPALFFKLTSCWWFGQYARGNGDRIADEIWRSIDDCRRRGCGWWHQNEVVARTALLQRITQPPNPTSSLLDQVSFVAMQPMDAPDGHCRFYAAAFLWQLLIRPTESERHHEAKLAMITPPRQFEPVLSRLGNIRCVDVDIYSPVSLVTTVWLITELWRTDFKASLLDIQERLFKELPASRRTVDLPVLFGLLPMFYGLWHTQKTSWAHNHDMKTSVSFPFEEEVDELFEMSDLMTNADGKVLGIILKSIHDEPDPYTSAALHQAALLIADRLVERSAAKDDRHHPGVDLFDIRDFVETLSGTSGVPDAELQRYCDTLTDDKASQLIEVARVNLLCAPQRRGLILSGILFNKWKRHAHWVELYRPLLQVLRAENLLKELHDTLRHVTTSVEWISDGELASLDNRCQVAGDLILTFIASRSQWVEEAANTLSHVLLENLRRRDATVDRFYNLIRTMTHRHLVPRVLRSLSSAPQCNRKEQLLRAAVCWDVAIAQRSLLDQRQYWLRADFPSHALTPCKDVTQSLGPAIFAEVYSAATSLGFGTVLSLKDAALYRSETKGKGSPDAKTVAQQHRNAPPRPATVCRSDTEDSGFADESSVADYLATGTVLVKIGFSLDGRLAWSAFRSQGGRLDLVGSDPGDGHKTADLALKAIVSIFDRTCEDILHREEQIADSLGEVCDALGAKDGDAHDFYANLLEQWVSQGESTITVADAFPFLLSEFGLPDEWENGTRRVPSLEDWVRQWNRQSRIDLNAATEDFLSRAASIIPVNDIGKIAEGRDVLFMLEESLFAIPLSFLRNSVGKRLFEIARSIRTVLSPAVHESFMRDESKPYSAGADDQVLCISGVPGNFPDEMVATKRLFEQHAKIAASKELKRPLTWRGAWDWPRGSHDVMARGIYDAEHGGARTALLTVLGHGHRDGGVELRPVSDEFGAEFWQAHCVRRTQKESRESDPGSIRPACDLSSVDFIIQVSCSVGRAEQDGLYDVQGFPANLVVAGARSTAAARWPILADEAERFANFMAERYLRRRDDAIRDSIPFREACVRGLAMADTRKWWLEIHRGSHTPSGDEFVGLHSAAAFELYGFG